MKKSSTRISANEMNRYMYCKHQWYYKRIYGAKALNEMYQALERKPSDHPEHFKKGLKHHKKYHIKYNVMKGIRVLILAGIMIYILMMIVKGANVWK